MTKCSCGMTDITLVVFVITVVNGYGLQNKFLVCTGKK